MSFQDLIKLVQQTATAAEWLMLRETAMRMIDTAIATGNFSQTLFPSAVQGICEAKLANILRNN